MMLVIALMSTSLVLALGTTVLLTTMTATAIAASHREGYQTLYAAEAATQFGVQDLSSVADWSSAIREGKTSKDVKTGKRGRARVTGGPGTARMAIELLRSVLNWAKVKPNPCDGVKTGSSGTRETILEDAEGYRRLFSTLDKMEAERRIRSPVADAIRLIALTGCRRSEAAGLCWKHVDLTQGRLVLPPQSHKTGRKTGKPREIILPAEAQKIIARQTEGAHDDFVFAPARGDGAVALSKAWRKVREEAELPTALGLHGLRHSIASHLAMGGAQAAEIMTAMGHRQMSTVQRYIHFAQNTRQTLAERAASVALAGMEKSSDPKGEGSA